MSFLLVVGLLLDLLLVSLVIVAGMAIALHFGGVGLRACPQCGESSLLPLETARTDGRLRQYHCRSCSASFEVALDGSLVAYPTSRSPN